MQNELVQGLIKIQDNAFTLEGEEEVQDEGEEDGEKNDGEENEINEQGEEDESIEGTEEGSVVDSETEGKIHSHSKDSHIIQSNKENEREWELSFFSIFVFILIVFISMYKDIYKKETAHKDMKFGTDQYVRR